MFSEISESFVDLFRPPSNPLKGLRGYILVNQSDELTSMSQPLSTMEDGPTRKDDSADHDDTDNGRARSASRLSTSRRQGIHFPDKNIPEEDEDDEHEDHHKHQAKSLIEESLDFEDMESTIWKKVSYILSKMKIFFN